MHLPCPLKCQFMGIFASQYCTYYVCMFSTGTMLVIQLFIVVLLTVSSVYTITTVISTGTVCSNQINIYRLVVSFLKSNKIVKSMYPICVYSVKRFQISTFRGDLSRYRPPGLAARRSGYIYGWVLLHRRMGTGVGTLSGHLLSQIHPKITVFIYANRATLCLCIEKL